MRADNKEMGEERKGPPPGRGMGRRQGGACFTRVEAVARSLVLSCTPLPWAVTR